MKVRSMASLPVVLLFAITVAIYATEVKERRPSTVGGVTMSNPDAHGRLPWRWTDDERIAARFDPISIAQRNGAFRGANLSSMTAAPLGHAQRTESVIDGRRNPELFMPFELFDSLVSAVDPRPEIRDKARTYLGPGIATLDLEPSEFWKTLETHAGQYARHRIAPQRDNGTAICAERVQTLTRMQTAIGNDILQRVLYQVVAPTMVHVESTNFPDPAGQLRRTARGCQ